MACCRAEEFKWCKELDTVYTDEEGKEYCVFHAPKGKKGIANIEEFDDLIFTRILEARNSKGICDFSGTIFSDKKGVESTFDPYLLNKNLNRIEFIHYFLNLPASSKYMYP